MTTICYRDGVLAADTAVFDRGVYCGQAEKIAASPCGTVGGGAGALGDISMFLDWLRTGCEGSPPPLIDQDSECIWIKPDGSTGWIGHNSKPTKIESPYFAAGSGFRVGLGAMAFGASAEQAVCICADLDNMTRRPLMTLRLGQANLSVAAE